MTRHPDDAQLARWLDTGKPAKVARHLEGCEECLERVEERTALVGPLVETLDTVSAPPPDMPERTTGGVRSRLAAEEAAGAFVDLFAIPWQFVSVMADPTARATTDQNADYDRERDDG